MNIIFRGARLVFPAITRPFSIVVTGGLHDKSQPTENLVHDLSCANIFMISRVIFSDNQNLFTVQDMDSAALPPLEISDTL